MGPGVCLPCPRGWARSPSGPSALGRELDCLTVESGSCCLGGRPSSVAPWWGAPRNWREGASIGLEDQSRPVSGGQCSGVPGTLKSRQRLEPPVSRGAASWPLLCLPSFICPEGPAPSTAWDCTGRRHEAVGRRGKSEPQERRLRAQEWNGEARASRRSGVFELKSGTARQERAAGAASSSSRVERRGKSEPQERCLRAQEWNGEARVTFSTDGFELRSGAARSRGTTRQERQCLRDQVWDGEARASRRSGVFELKSGTAWQERAAGAASSSSRVERRGKSEPQERRLRAQEWNGEARVTFSTDGFELRSGAARSRGTARQERAAGAASSSSRVERRGKSEPQERRLRAQEWNGEARASFITDGFELRSGAARSRGTARQERAAGAASSSSGVERRGKSEPQERRLRAQEWNGEARVTFSTDGFELRSGAARSRGTARQERAAGAASSSSRVERRGKSEPQERRLRAQEWNGEARVSFSTDGFELRSGAARSRGTARQERAAGAASSSSRVERRGKSEPQERHLRAQEWNGEARASFITDGFELRSGAARSRGTTRQERQCLRDQVWDGEARASLELKRDTRDPLGKGLFQARAPSRCHGRLCAGRPPCAQGWVFATVGLLPLCSFGCPERGATL
ncbi:uncharacterized protein LOC127059229 [Serinus canaria]|uniref:uncharacterized protein LOC127059229 n=1 Tax=Serinus canaria TaxID=9135 RepID=UPI0021CC7DE5|nr:uncharacterized protein LOC127059229 [Serinus canaria]